MTAIVSKFQHAITRLATKIGNSVTPVPGFLVGLSGTDSILTFIMLYRALAEHGKAHRLVGIHYVDDNRRNLTWMEREVLPWLKDNCLNAQVYAHSPVGVNRDHQRWADLLLRSTHYLDEDHGYIPYEEGDGYWVSGTLNATEKALGKYSIMQNATSIQPLQTFWKYEVLALCEHYKVPKIAIDNSRIPDCLCGRDDIAAANIELIDMILKFEDLSFFDPKTVKQVTEWVRTTKKRNSFRQRLPYNI